jgi:protein arginine kinase activator
VTDETGFGLAEAFLNQPTAAADLSNVVCEACGFTAAQLKKIGRMGCPECYSAFKDGLDSLLKAMHKGTRHVGKTPRTIFPEGRSMKNIKQLREDLNTAVREERYEDAAKLKNEIQELQHQLAGKA